MELNKKTEIVLKHILKSLEELQKERGQQITFSFGGKHSKGEIFIKINA